MSNFSLMYIESMCSLPIRYGCKIRLVCERVENTIGKQEICEFLHPVIPRCRVQK